MDQMINFKLTMGRTYLISFVIIFTVLACSTKHERGATQEDEWPEMDAFHRTMAEAFHPLKDSGNVEPAIRLIQQLEDDVDKWVSSSIPDKVNNDEMKSKLEELKTDIHALAEAVRDGASVEQIGTSMHTVHDQFHEIMEAWHGGDSDEGHVQQH